MEDKPKSCLATRDRVYHATASLSSPSLPDLCVLPPLSAHHRSSPLHHSTLTPSPCDSARLRHRPRVATPRRPRAPSSVHTHAPLLRHDSVASTPSPLTPTPPPPHCKLAVCHLYPCSSRSDLKSTPVPEARLSPYQYQWRVFVWFPYWLIQYLRYILT
jgi:hypothetical protein